MPYQVLIQKQTAFFNSNKTKELGFRVAQLKKLKTLIKSSEKVLCDAIYKDFKKSEFDAYTTEIGLIYRDIDEAIKQLPEWSRRKRVSSGLLNFPAESYIIPEPLGVC